MNNYLNVIKKKLKSFVEREKRRDGLKRFFIFVSALFSFILLFVVLESIGNFSFSTRTFLFWFTMFSAIILSSVYIALPFVKDFIFYSSPDYVETSKKVGNHFPEIKDELSNAVQLIEDKNHNCSNDLIDAAFKRIFDKAEQLDFNKVIDFSPVKKYGRICTVILSTVIVSIVFVQPFNSAAIRLVNFNKSYTLPPRFIFEINPGNKEITKGDNVAILIKTHGEHPKEIFLSLKSEEDADYTEKKLIADSAGIFSYVASTVKSSFEYFANSKNINSDVYKISVIDRPIITSFDLNIFPPSYSRLPEQYQKDNGNTAVLPGTKLKLTLTSSRDLSAASIVFGDSSKLRMNINSNKANISFPVHKESDYQLIIQDAQNNSNINPITYSIKTITDEPPSIEMISPNGNIKLGKENKISLVAKIRDNYGFSKMNLNYRLSASKYRQSTDAFTQNPITISLQLKEDDIYFIWDLAPIVLAEGEVLSYFLEIFDNDNINGPKSARTQQFTITVPSLDELLADATNKQEGVSKDLKETLLEADKLKQEMQKISDDLKQNSKDISWQEKERIEKAVDNFKDITKKIDDVSQKLSDMKNELAKNNLLSDETLQKYNELQDLLEQMNSNEMKEAFKRLQEALKSMIRDNVQLSMEEIKANEEFIKKSIERTINLLKRIQIEQKVDELVKRTEEISGKLDDLKSKTDQSNLFDKQKRDELTKRQGNITEDIANLNDEMKNLSDKMRELNDMPKNELDKIQKEFDNQNNEKISEDVQKSLQQMQKSSAVQNQNMLMKNMKNLGKQFQNLQQSLRQMNQLKTFTDMMKILDDLITLSKDQEKLKDDTEELSPYSKEFPEYSRKQSELQENLGKVLQKMADLSQKTFAITPEMGRALGKALSNMQQSMMFMQNQNGPATSQKQKEAMASINEAAGLLKGGMDQMMSGRQSGGMMSLMQQLQMMAQQQMNLNQITQMMNQEQLSQEMTSQMQRLAQEQEAIRKSLEQLNQEAKESGQSKRLAANLEKILNEMKEVVTNLESNKLNNDLVKQQERILSKLLDAQTSLNERDYEKERKSAAGSDFDRNSPPDLILKTEEGKNKLKDELMKAIREGYKKDYEDLIRKYFEALEKVNREK